jgi:hypothetical protein
MSILDAGFGFIGILVGRPMYAVFTGIVGFLIGNYLEGVLNVAPPGWGQITFSLLLAAFGALAALTFKRWAVKAAGFIAGGFLIYNLPMALGAEKSWGNWLLFLIAGGVCVILLSIWFDFALMTISTLTGVALILPVMKFGRIDAGSMFFILALFGIVTQFLLLQYGKPSPD